MANQQQFAVGDPVRYRPGTGTYGYEDSLGEDGRVPGTVIGHSPARIRCTFTLAAGRTVTRSVDAASLVKVAR